MISYDAASKMLTFSQVENPDMGDRFNVLDDIINSYHEFEERGVLEACEEINNVLKELGCDDTLKFTASKESGYGTDQEHVVVKATVAKNPMIPPIIVVRIPYMDNLGKLHFFDRSVKNIVNRITSASDISYDADKEVLSIVMSKKIIKISCGIKTKDIQVHGKGKSKIEMSALITFLSKLEGNVLRPGDVIANPVLQSVMHPAVYSGTPLPMRQIRSEDKTGLIEGLFEDADFEVSAIRDSINRAVSIDRALGETLSRPVGGFEKGTYITPSVLQSLKKQHINQFYVECIVPYPKKRLKSTLDGKSLIFTMIPKGTENTAFLESIRPEFAGISVFDEDVRLNKNAYDASGIIDLTGAYATEEVLEFLKSMGVNGVQLRSGEKGKNCPFEMEIIGNYTVRKEDIGLDEDGWIATKEGANSDKLTADDLLALYSTLGYMAVRKSYVFMDRDRDFLKRVELADDLVDKALREAIRSHVFRYNAHIRSYINGALDVNSTIEPFTGLTKMLKSTLQSMEVIATPDTTNLVAEIAQATHITNPIKRAPEIMRQVAVPYYGRICPFETPEGKKVGLVNSKAIGCHIKGEELLVPVRKVIRVGDEITVSDVIEEKSVKDEEQLRVSDIMQLTPSTTKGRYKNTRVIAVVPNPDPVGERRVYATIPSIDLDYVFAHTEAFLSAATCMIPCASSDDAVRVSFGTKMIKSAIYLMNPDKPRVQTFMYRDIFNSTDAYLIKAKKSGMVTDISKNHLSVMYDGDVNETDYHVEEFKVTSDAVMFMRYRVIVGQRFNKGDILMDCAASRDGVYAPGRNELIAYIPTGYNHEDALHVCERATIDYISIKTSTVSQNCSRDAAVDKSGMYKYYNAGDIITEITDKDGSQICKRNVKLGNHSGIWYDTTLERDGRVSQYKFKFLGYNRLGKGDKMSGLHGNKGVSARVEKNSEMPMLANGKVIRILPNPHGLPSRMNIGQIKECHLGLIATVLGIYINSDPFNGATTEDVATFMKLSCELANCGDASKCRSICSKYDLPSALVDHLESRMDLIMQWANTFDENGDAYVWLPTLMKWLPTKVTIGVSTFLKMKQEVDEKIAMRGGVFEERYVQTTSQPTQGSEAGGGQKIGEMEQWALLAYGAAKVVHDTWNCKTDNECARVNMELDALHSDGSVSNTYNYPRSVYNFIYSLQCFGLMLEDDKGRLPRTDMETSRDSYVYDVKKIIEDWDKDEGKKIVLSAEDKGITDDVMNSLFNGG